MVISSWTNRKTSSIASRVTPAGSVTSQPSTGLGIEGGEVGHGVEPRHDRGGAEVAQVVEERERVGAVAQHVRREGDPDRQPVAAGAASATGAGSAPVRPVAGRRGRRARRGWPGRRPARPRRDPRSGDGCSPWPTGRRSRGRRSPEPWPWRTRSKAVSKSWVNAATRSKPNIAPEPLMVWSARNAVSISALSCGFSPRSSKVVSRQARSSSASMRNTSTGLREVMSASTLGSRGMGSRRNREDGCATPPRPPRLARSFRRPRARDGRVRAVGSVSGKCDLSQ